MASKLPCSSDLTSDFKLVAQLCLGYLCLCSFIEEKTKKERQFFSTRPVGFSAGNKDHPHLNTRNTVRNRGLYRGRQHKLLTIHAAFPSVDSLTLPPSPLQGCQAREVGETENDRERERAEEGQRDSQNKNTNSRNPCYPPVRDPGKECPLK